MAAINDAATPKFVAGGNPSRLAGRAVSPVTHPTNWQVVNSAPGSYNGGGNSTLISRIDSFIANGGAGVTPLKVDGVGTSVLVSMIYDSSKTLTSGPVVKVIGLDEYGVGHYLADATGATSWTLTANSAIDAGGVTADGPAGAMIANGRLVHAMANVDAMNYDRVIVVVYTAAVGDGYTEGRIVAKVI